MLHNHPEHKLMHRLPKITNPAAGPGHSTLFWGGDQGWYSRYTCRKSGCGPVAAANLLAFYSQTNPAERSGSQPFAAESFSRQDFLRLMEHSYQTMGTFELPWISHWADRRQETIQYLLAESTSKSTAKATKMQRNILSHVPPSLGNSTRSFVKGTLRLAQEYGLNWQPHILQTWRCQKQKGLDFIFSGLSQGSPVVLLTRFNSHKIQLFPHGPAAPCRESKITTPHFMTLWDIQQKKGQPSFRLVASTWGMLAVIEYDDLFQSWQKPGAFGSSLLYFKEKSSVNGT